MSERANEALNLAMLGDDLVNYFDGDSEGEDRAYWFGAARRLGDLAAAGVFQDAQSEIRLNPDKLKEDWSEHFDSFSKDVLRMYLLAGRGTPETLKEARALAKDLAHLPDTSLLERMRSHLQ